MGGDSLAQLICHVQPQYLALLHCYLVDGIVFNWHIVLPPVTCRVIVTVFAQG